MMWRASGWMLVFAVGLIAGTMLVQPVAATPPEPIPAPDMPVVEQNLDADGYIAVHEQGTADVNVVGGSMTVGGTVSANQVGDWSVDVDNFPAVQPVSGTVSVGNFPTTQDVNVTNGSLAVSGTVQIGNSASSPVLVEEAAASSRTPFVFRPTTTSDTYTVPAGKNAVIEFYSAHSTGTEPSYFDPVLTVYPTSGPNIGHHLGVGRYEYTLSAGTSSEYSGSGPITLYLGPGDQVEVRANCMNACGYSMSIVGYLEDAS
jgi:hypothetical protein